MPTPRFRQNEIMEALAKYTRGEPGRKIVFETLRGKHLYYAIGREDRSPAGSLIKIPAAMCLEDAFQNAYLNPDEKIEVDSFRFKDNPSIFSAFQAQHELTLRELTYLTLTVTDNDVTNYLLMRLGQAKIDDFLKMQDYLQTKIFIGNGDRYENVTTCWDLHRIFLDLYTNQDSLVWKALLNNMRTFRMPAYLKDECVIAHKSGTLNGVVNDVGIILGDEFDFFVSFLGNQDHNMVKAEEDIAECIREIMYALGEGKYVN